MYTWKEKKLNLKDICLIRAQPPPLYSIYSCLDKSYRDTGKHACRTPPCRKEISLTDSGCSEYSHCQLYSCVHIHRIRSHRPCDRQRSSGDWSSRRAVNTWSHRNRSMYWLAPEYTWDRHSDTAFGHSHCSPDKCVYRHIGVCWTRRLLYNLTGIDGTRIPRVWYSSYFRRHIGCSCIFSRIHVDNIDDNQSLPNNLFKIISFQSVV